jgi:AcrR family transcriptional regulator
MIPQTRIPWHHGDLPAALLRVGRELLDSRPHTELTLRGLAAAVSEEGVPVTHTAAAAHFGSMAGLLAALATDGWAELQEALDTGGGELRELSRSYVEFALTQPNRFRLMYDSHLWLLVNQEPTSAGDPVQRMTQRWLEEMEAGRNACYLLFVEAVSRGQRAGTLQPGDASVLARMVAALSHGIAMECIDENLHVHLSSSAAQQSARLAEAGALVELAIKGIGTGGAGKRDF